MLQITVDLTAPSSLLVKTAKLILQFAGYEPPAAAGPQVQSPADALIARGKEITRGDMEARDAANQIERSDMVAGARIAVEALGGETPSPETAFAAGIGGNLTVSTGYPPIAVPLPPAPAGIDVDAQGLPWDARIHSSTRAKNADGTWRQKRGVDKELLAQVEAELRHTLSVPVPPRGGPDTYYTNGPDRRAAALPETVPVVPPPPFAGNAAPPAPPAASGTPPVPASAGAATTASPGSVTNGAAPSDIKFAQLMPKITQGFTAGTLTKPAIDAALAKVGLSMVPQLALRPDLVGAVATELGIAL